MVVNGLSPSDIRFDSEPHTTVHQPIAISQKGLAHAPSYWAMSAGEEVETQGELCEDIVAPVAIIGGGFTGLSTAYHLARRGIKAVVLEANRVGWGASGRNGGFAMICVGKEEYSEMLARSDPRVAQQQFNLGLQAVKTVEEIIDDNRIDVDRSEAGWLSVAHKPSRMADLRRTAEVLRKGFGYETELLTKEVVRSSYVDSPDIHGGIYFPDGFGLHPLKYARGIARAAIAHGALVHIASPVVHWSKNGSRHILRTPKGTVRADSVVVATAGYTLDALNPWISGRILPAISNIVVTRPLSRAEQIEAGLHRTIVTSDTRRLVFYYRLLPDGRLLLGARGGLQDERQQNKHAYEWLSARLGDLFPGLKAVEIDFFWRGWVCLSRDQNPHIGTTDDPTVHYALAYMGNGVALASHFGKLLAGRLAGHSGEPDIAILKTPLPKFELPALRELSLRAAYFYYGIKDRYL